MLLAQLYVPFTIKFQSLIDTFSHPIVLLKQLFVLLLVLNYKQEKILCFLAWFKCLPFFGVLKNQNGEVTSKRLRFQEWNTWLARPRLVFKAISTSVNYNNFDEEKWNYFSKDISLWLNFFPQTFWMAWINKKPLELIDNAHLTVQKTENQTTKLSSQFTVR